MRWRIKNKKKIKTNDFYYDLSFWHFYKNIIRKKSKKLSI